MWIVWRSVMGGTRLLKVDVGSAYLAASGYSPRARDRRVDPGLCIFVAGCNVIQGTFALSTYRRMTSVFRREIGFINQVPQSHFLGALINDEYTTDNQV